jgi:tetratricopeptide (TPR) repeat protein
MGRDTSVLKLRVSLLAAMLMVSSLRAQNSPADHFARGKKLMEDNCIDCMGGTQQGEEEGIQELELALQAQYEKPVEAYKALADAYANMATYVGKNQSESKAFWDKQQEVYRKMYALAPDDPEVLADYEQTLTDVNEKISICRKILGLTPRNADARFQLGDLLLQQNKMKESLGEMKQAIMLESDPEAVRNDTQRLIEGLAQHQCPLKNADVYNDEVFKAETAATQGQGNPKPMAIFKKKLVAALEQHTCAPASPK